MPPTSIDHPLLITLHISTMRAPDGFPLHVCAVATDEPATPDAVGSCVTKRRFARSSSLTGTLEATALASFTHSACIIIDMGNFVLSECRNRAYTGEDAALPCIAGEHVRQILPEALLERAALLPPFDPASQVLCCAAPCALPAFGRGESLSVCCVSSPPPPPPLTSAPWAPPVSQSSSSAAVAGKAVVRVAGWGVKGIIAV